MLTSSPAALARLRRLCAAVERVATGSPVAIRDFDVAQGAEQSLVAAVADCLSFGKLHHNATHRRNYAQIMRRFHRALDSAANVVKPNIKRPGNGRRAPKKCVAHSYANLAGPMMILVRPVEMR